MKIKFLALIAAVMSLQQAAAATVSVNQMVADSAITRIAQRQTQTEQEMAKLTARQGANAIKLDTLDKALDAVKLRADSLASVCQLLKETQSEDRNTINGRIDRSADDISANTEALRSRTVWGGMAAAILLAVIAFVAYRLTKKSDVSALASIRKAQETLKEAQSRLEEESVKLDSQLLELIGREMEAKPASEQDHSLVVKIADEIARIETNLAKMDKAVKGYKQLVQAKDRMINNVRAYGYEIVSLLGQEYNDGMQYQARFVPDENLPEGKRIITGMIKMQVNYNGKMIQPAEIVVSQNI
ncbi:MAG: hypothetical protein ACI35Q_06090 [Marinilabiliaceae bacterium]